MHNLPWTTIKHTKLIDWSEAGIFSHERDDDGRVISATYNMDSTTHIFKQPLPAKMQLVSNWSVSEAGFVDPDDEEDPVKLARRFASVRKDWVFTEEEVKKAELEQNADDVRIEEKIEPAESKSGASSSKLDAPVASPAKRAKIETPTTDESKSPAKAPPKVQTLKATRRPQGAVKAKAKAVE